MTGPRCYYFRLRGIDGTIGHRVLFRSSEIKTVERTPLGAMVWLRNGVGYRVTSPTPELAMRAPEKAPTIEYTEPLP